MPKLTCTKVSWQWVISSIICLRLRMRIRFVWKRNVFCIFNFCTIFSVREIAKWLTRERRKYRKLWCNQSYPSCQLVASTFYLGENSTELKRTQSTSFCLSPRTENAPFQPCILLRITRYNDYVMRPRSYSRGLHSRKTYANANC